MRKIVSYFRYLDILFSYDERFRNGVLELVGVATKTLYSLIGTARRYELPDDIQIELFNALVVPVLTYDFFIYVFIFCFLLFSLLHL